MPLRNFFTRPETIFLFFSLIVGLVLCVLIPPLGGGNEVYNFERAVSFAYGYPLVEKSQVPSGIGEFIDAANGFFREGIQPPFHFPRALYEKMFAIPLDAGKSTTLLPSASMHHPFCYIPQALFIKLGAPTSFWTSIGKSSSDFPALTWSNFFIGNLLPVTIGNIIGGSLMVAAVYWFIYLREEGK